MTKSLSDATWDFRLVAGLCISDMGQMLLAEDCGFKRVVLEFKKVVEGIFQEKSGVFKACTGVAAPGFMIEA